LLYKSSLNEFSLDVCCSKSFEEAFLRKSSEIKHLFSIDDEELKQYQEKMMQSFKRRVSSKQYAHDETSFNDTHDNDVNNILMKIKREVSKQNILCHELESLNSLKSTITDSADQYSLITNQLV